MKAVVIRQFGGPEQLELVELPSPPLTAGAVRIDVVATAVNRADLLQRQGFYPPPPGASDILGLECAGVVSEVSAEVTTVAVGDNVCALLSGGGYAQEVIVPAGQVMPTPPGIDLVRAAAFPEVACTVWSNLTDVARLQPDEWVLIHGGAGGIGTFAIQYAKAIGARVATTAGSPEKLDLCRELGADVAINYREQDFAEVLRERGIRANVILDNMGAKYLTANISSLAADGRLVVIGLQGGVKGELNLGSLISLRGSINATSLRSRNDAAKARICRGVVSDMWPMIGSGLIRPVIDDTVELTQVSQAHTRMQDSLHQGKILMTLR